MTTTTYSFSDINLVINPFGRPAFTINGQGVGEVNIAYANDNTSHELAADGSVMVSRITANNGTISISAQQTSRLHGWLMGLFNALNDPQTPAALWASIRIDITTLTGLQDNKNFTGVSFTKRADQPYQQQGQMVTWNFMFADGQGMGTQLPSNNLV